MQEQRQETAYAFRCLDQLYRCAMQKPVPGVRFLVLSDRLNAQPHRVEQWVSTLHRKRLLIFGAQGTVRLTPLGTAMVLLAHEDRSRSSANFEALDRMPLSIPVLISDGSIGEDGLVELSTQLDGMVSALEGTWRDRMDLSALLDELDLRLWRVHDYPFFAVEELLEVVDILVQY